MEPLVSMVYLGKFLLAIAALCLLARIALFVFVGI